MLGIIKLYKFNKKEVNEEKIIGIQADFHLQLLKDSLKDSEPLKNAQ
jgi:hypothetical protein